MKKEVIFGVKENNLFVFFYFMVEIVKYMNFNFEVCLNKEVIDLKSCIGE